MVENEVISPVFRTGCTPLCVHPPLHLNVVEIKVKVKAKVVERKIDPFGTFTLKKMADALLGK
jgi:predicted short-subunit dehydrogenase-like oxidoreductase (DUF2520 family)